MALAGGQTQAPEGRGFPSGSRTGDAFNIPAPAQATRHGHSEDGGPARLPRQPVLWDTRVPPGVPL